MQFNINPILSLLAEENLAVKVNSIELMNNRIMHYYSYYPW